MQGPHPSFYILLAQKFASTYAYITEIEITFFFHDSGKQAWKK